MVDMKDLPSFGILFIVAMFGLLMNLLYRLPKQYRPQSKLTALIARYSLVFGSFGALIMAMTSSFAIACCGGAIAAIGVLLAEKCVPLPR
jgi:hypothetical protein